VGPVQAYPRSAIPSPGGSSAPAARQQSHPWGPDFVWAWFHRPVPTRGWLRWSHPQGRETGWPAGAGADQVRNNPQPQDRQGARPRSAADAARPRRRGHRM